MLPFDAIFDDSTNNRGTIKTKDLSQAIKFIYFSRANPDR